MKKTSHTPRQKFTKQEDDLIKMKWQQKGPECIKELTQILGRNRKQIRDRYYFYLAPDVDNGPFTDEDDCILAKLILKHGFKWTSFTKFLKGKGTNDVKNRWRLVTSRIKANDLKKIEKIVANGGMSPLAVEYVQSLDWDGSYLEYLSKEIVIRNEFLYPNLSGRSSENMDFEETFDMIKDSQVGSDSGKNFIEAFEENMERSKCREEILRSEAARNINSVSV